MYSLIIVDDDELIRKGLEKVIPWNKLGFEVTATFSSALDALEYLRNRDVDVILTDVKMPKMSGLELIEEAKRLNPTCKAVIISGFGEFELVKSALTLKAEDYLLKPLSQNDIETVFRKVAKMLDTEDAPRISDSGIGSCYDLAKTLVNEFPLWEEYVSGASDRTKYKLCLVQYEGAVNIDTALENTLSGLHHASKNTYATFLVPENEFSVRLENVRNLFAAHPQTTYRIMIGSDVSWIDDIIPSFWSAFDILQETQANTVASYVYELVREENGSIEIAKDLSEGERNFIAFLYFYHTVMGSQSDDGRVDDKIVVIDDPVSSMDQQTLFYVSALTREMIAVCYNNFEMDEEKGADEHIRQFFCLTHNPVFFRDITYNRISQYECVTFFEITKDKDNHSHVEECWEEITATGGGYLINKSPVRNYYDSLWHELRTTDSPEMLMSVARQILEFFFLQTGGYKSAKLRDLLFEGDNKREFERQLADGSIDRTYYNIATSMIALLDVGVTNFNDGLFFDSSAFSVDQMKDAFAIIFDVMRQPQHYKLMMGMSSTAHPDH